MKEETKAKAPGLSALVIAVATAVGLVAQWRTTVAENETLVTQSAASDINRVAVDQDLQEKLSDLYAAQDLCEVNADAIEDLDRSMFELSTQMDAYKSTLPSDTGRTKPIQLRVPQELEHDPDPSPVIVARRPEPSPPPVFVESKIGYDIPSKIKEQVQMRAEQHKK